MLAGLSGDFDSVGFEDAAEVQFPAQFLEVYPGRHAVSLVEGELFHPPLNQGARHLAIGSAYRHYLG